MSYAEHGPRIFRTGRSDSSSVLRYGEYIIPKKRSEGRMKLFGSCTDLRAWSPNSFENLRYFKEVVEKPLPQGKIVPYNVMIEILKLLDTQTQTELNSLRQQLKGYKSLRLSPEQRSQLQNLAGYSLEEQNQIEDGPTSLRETKSTDDEVVVPERPGTPEHSIYSSSSNYESESVHRSRIDDESLSEYRFEELNRVASSKTDSNEYVDLSEENRADTHAIIIEKESEIIALKNELGAKDVEVEQLKDVVRNLEATLDNLRENLNISQQQIFALSDQLKQGMEESTRRLHKSKSAVDNLRTSLAEKSQECDARALEIEHLRKRSEDSEIIREERDCLLRTLKDMCEERNTLKDRNCEQAMDLADQSDEINQLLGLLNSQAAKYSEREKQMERMLNELRAEISCCHRDSSHGLNDSASLSGMANLDIRKLRCALLEDLQRVEDEMRKRCEEAQRDHRGTNSKATWKCNKGLMGCTNVQLKTMQVPERGARDEDEKDDEIYKRIVSQTSGSLEKIQRLIIELKPYQDERLNLIENVNYLTECLKTNEAQNREADLREVKEKGEREENEKAHLSEEALNEKIDEALVIHVKRSIERVEKIALCLEGAGDYISREMSKKDKEVEARNQEIAKLKVQVASRVSRGQGDHAAQEEHPSDFTRVKSDPSTTRRTLQRTPDQLQSIDFKLKGANQKIKDLGLEIERLTKENKGLNNTVHSTNDLAIKVDEMEIRLDSLQEENSELCKRVARANELCSEYENKLMDLKDEGMKAQEAFERAESRLQSLLLGRDSKIDALREEKETAKRELDETRLKVAALTEQLKSLRTQNKNLDFLEAQIREIVKLDRRTKKLRDTVESMKSHLDEQRRANDLMEEKLNVILEENERVHRETERLRVYVERKSNDSIVPRIVAKQELNISSNEVPHRLETPKASQNSWESVDLAYQSEINYLKEKSLNDASVMEDLRRDIDSWKNRAAEQEKIILALRETNERLQEDLQRRMEEIQSIKEAARDEKSSSATATRELIAKTERLEGEIREKDERIEKLAREIKTTKEECKNLSEKVQSLNSERTELATKLRSDKVSWQNKATELLQQQYNQRVRALHDQHNESVKKLQAQHEEYVKNYGNPFDPETWLQSLTIKETKELHKRICKSVLCDASTITRALNDKQNQQLQEDEKLLHSDIINLKTGHLKESTNGYPGYMYERRKFNKSMETPVKDNATFNKQQTNFIYQCAMAHNDSGN